MNDPIHDPKTIAEPEVSAKRIAMDEVCLAMLEAVARVCIHTAPEQQQLAELRGHIIASGILQSRNRIEAPLVDAGGKFVSANAQSVAETLGGLFADLCTPRSRQIAGVAISRILSSDSPIEIRNDIADLLSPLFSFIEGYDARSVFTEFLDKRLGGSTSD
ncbi:MAG: hypothetical protein KDD70_08520 [Bdellovibrionales bacterium]|nr:hypothetical protein [Bdellovibrionales bacterium]